MITLNNKVGKNHSHPDFLIRAATECQIKSAKLQKKRAPNYWGTTLGYGMGPQNDHIGNGILPRLG